MSTDKLKQLISHCKCGVYITVNEHKDAYDSVEKWLFDNSARFDDGLDPVVLEAMIDLDRVVEIQFYPDTPVGFYIIPHHDIDEALNEALNIVGNKPRSGLQYPVPQNTEASS